MNGWRTALRIAWREARRAKGRATLVVVMIAMPIAALTLGVVTFQTFRLSPDESADRMMGSAQAIVAWYADNPIQQVPDQLNVLGLSTPKTDLEQPPEVAEPTEERLLALLPPGSSAISDYSTRVPLRTATGVAPINTRLLDYADPLATGIYRQLSGRAPTAADEVALTPAATRRLGAVEGGTVRPADGSTTLRVVGVIEDPNDLRATTIVALPDSTLARSLTDSATDRRAQTEWLVATPDPLTWDEVKQLNTHGISAVSRHVLANPPSQAELYQDLLFEDGSDDGLGILLLIGGLAMLEVVLLAGPAFAVGARRRRRDLALVAAAGGTPAHIRRIVLADGVVLGVVAGAAGVALGALAAVASIPVFEEYGAQMRAGELRLVPLTLATIAGLAVLTGALAALAPAWISARQDVVTALAGRRGIIRSRRRWFVLGGALAAAGAAVAGFGAWQVDWGLILVGLVIGEFGLVLCTPALVGLVARAGRSLPLAPRIALRDTSRNRTAAAPAISAVMAATVGTLAVAVVYSASVEREVRDYRTLGTPGDVTLFEDRGKVAPADLARPIPDEALSTLRTTMPVDQVHQVTMASCGEACPVEVQVPPDRACRYAGLDRALTSAEQRAARDDARCAGAGQRYLYFMGWASTVGLTLVVEESALSAVAKIPAEDLAEVAAALRAGAVVVDDDRYLVDGRVTLTLGTGPARRRTVSATGFVLPTPPPAPITLMSTQTAQSLGLTASPMLAMATTTRMPTVEETDRLQAALGDGVVAMVEHEPAQDRSTLLILAIVAGIITFTAAAIATGLAAADGRADLATLAAVGASPGVRRALSMSQAGVIAGLGALLGAVVGLGAAIAVLATLNRSFAGIWPVPTEYPIAVPWLNVYLAVLVVPLIAVLAAGLLTRSRLPVERRL